MGSQEGRRKVRVFWGVEVGKSTTIEVWQWGWASSWQWDRDEQTRRRKGLPSGFYSHGPGLQERVALIIFSTIMWKTVKWESCAEMQSTPYLCGQMLKRNFFPSICSSSVGGTLKERTHPSDMSFSKLEAIEKLSSKSLLEDAARIVDFS